MSKNFYITLTVLMASAVLGETTSWSMDLWRTYLKRMAIPEFTLREVQPLPRENDVDGSSHVGDGEMVEVVAEHDLRYLSFQKKELLKTAGSIEEVAKITGVHLQPTLKKGTALRKVGRRGRPDRNGQIKHVRAEEESCEIETVTHDLIAMEGYRAVPPCVRVPKCGGCCNPGSVCEATETKTRSVTVLHLSLTSDSIKEVYHNVSEDAGCRCACKVKEEDCLPTQYYNSEKCICLCNLDQDSVRAECEARNFLWDPYRCECRCSRRPYSSSDCGSGETFNPRTCSCDYK